MPDPTLEEVVAQQKEEAVRAAQACPACGEPATDAGDHYVVNHTNNCSLKARELTFSFGNPAEVAPTTILEIPATVPKT